MGRSTVFINGQGMSSTDSDALSISSSDVCLTPMGPGFAPIPFTNTARSASLAGGTKSVNIDGGMGAIDGCSYSRSTGDEAGTGKGVASGAVGDKAEFINCSFDVKFEGRGACRNLDPMTHNSKNAMGMNQDSSAPPANQCAEPAGKNSFHFRVVEHLSWDAYDEDTSSFRFGHKSNKPVAGRKFKILMPDGSVIERVTDDDGVIEVPGHDPTAAYRIIFEPENPRLNNSYILHYKRMPLQRKL